MDKFCLVAIMLFAIQRDMTDHPIVDVIDAIDRERDILKRADFLELEFADAMCKHDIYNISLRINGWQTYTDLKERWATTTICVQADVAYIAFNMKATNTFQVQQIVRRNKL